MQNAFSFFKIKLVAIVVCCFSNIYAQVEVPTKKSLETSVYDGAGMLSQSEKKTLEQKLIHYADTTSTQIVIATIPSLEGGSIDILATDWAHKWGVGQEKKDNGVFVLIAESEHKIVIKTGYGTQIYLTDAISKTIIEQIILPEFKKEQYYIGLDKGVTAIMQVLNGTFKNDGKSKKDTSKLFFLMVIIVVIVVLLLISKRNKKNGKGNNGKGGRKSGGFDIFDALLIGSIGSSFGGGFGGGSSGGGFGGGGFSGGFGGGGFGGGGAGGSW